MQTWNPEYYARHSSAQFGWARELIGRLQLGGDEALVDIGCGDGKIDALLAGLLPRGRVVGVDASAEMIRLASTRYPPAQHPNLSFLQMDARRLDPPGRFQVAFSNAALHWVDDQEAVLEGLRACLDPGGRLLFQMGGRGNAADILAAGDDVIRRPAWRSCFENFEPAWYFHGPEDYAGWLPRHRFRPVRVELLPRDMRYPDADGLLGWLSSTWMPFTSRVPVAQREQFLEDVLHAYLAARPPDADGTVHVAMRRLEVEAVAI